MKKGYHMHKIIEDATKEKINMFAFIKIKIFLCKRALKRLKNKFQLHIKLF